MRFFCVITRYNVFNVWPKTTLLPVWPRDAKSLDSPALMGRETLRLLKSPALPTIVQKQEYLEMSCIFLWHMPFALEQPGGLSCNNFTPIHRLPIPTFSITRSFFLFKLEEPIGNQVIGDCRSIIVLRTLTGQKEGQQIICPFPSYFNVSPSSQ